MRQKLPLIVLVLCISAHAGVIEDLKHSCFERASPHVGFHWTEQCIEDIFTLRPVHPAIQTIAPGTGPAFGLGFDMIRRKSRAEWVPSALLVRSTDGSTLAQAGFTVAIPPWSLISVDDDDTSVVTNDELGYHDSRNRSRPEGSHGSRLAFVRDYWKLDSKLSMSFNVQFADMREQNFYGLGPETSRSGLALYKQKQTTVRFAINDPLTTWADIGLSADFIHPQIQGVYDKGSPAIGQLYTEATAPGLQSQPDFVSYEPYIRFRLPVKNYHFRLTEFRVGYGFFHDLDSARYSFRRLEASVRSEQDIRLPSKHTASNRSAIANFLCPDLRSRKHCTAGTFTFVALVDAAYTGANSAVPFYLDPTLGGADIRGNDTLRGFVDYRFRGPSRMLFQTEYRHRIWGPIGILGFYDVGRVAIQPSDLAFEHLRHDTGVGLYISAANRIVLRAYVGFGTGEGIRPNYKLPTSMQ